MSSNSNTWQTCVSKVIVFCVTPVVPESFMIVSSTNVLVKLFLMVGGFGGRSYHEKCERTKFCVGHLGYCVNKSTACYHQYCTVSMIYGIYGSVPWPHHVRRSSTTHHCPERNIFRFWLCFTMVFPHKHFSFFDANRHQPIRPGGQHQRTKGLAGTSAVRSATSPDCRCQSNASQDEGAFNIKTQSGPIHDQLCKKCSRHSNMPE